ncbi:MAG: type I DNA topoisomerase [Candidatus Latescibacteria bacterium]|jgi:DNA topoisomerase-1|nr:type I DNA topoisomerase [Candidatus Latescibacterota bacterium]
MAKNLIIVESPAKARTISRFVGKDYKVAASMGHVRDLPARELGFDTENFDPRYEVSQDKRKVIQALKKDVGKDTTVYLATDEDREGESISWHLISALGLKKQPIKRIVFHEITKTAILHALDNPRELDQNLVDAQQARRILDRAVGYKLSPLLWKKVKGGLSAGRVQSVAVRIIVDREREIRAFKPEEYWKIKSDFKDPKFQAELARKDGKKASVKNEAEAKAIEASALNGQFVVAEVVEREGKRRPVPPFTTSTLQQEASRKLGFSVSQTMRIAQQLYEGNFEIPGYTGGLITYMRTDSVNLSEQAVNQAREVIAQEFGREYTVDKPRQFANKTKGAQEAHEAIRPADLSIKPTQVKAYLDPQQFRLYDLIWKRTLATQMAEARIAYTTLRIQAGEAGELIFEAKGQRILFPGFLRAYTEGSDDPDAEISDKDVILPKVEKGQVLNLEKLHLEQLFTKPPARYTEASLVKKMESEGIGRPSTYSPTISTIQNREYVERTKDKKLKPTDIGEVVNDFLVEHFPDIVNLSFTSHIEDDFDEIAQGKNSWKAMLKEFYPPFQERVEDKKSVDRIGRKLGKDPDSGRDVSVRFGKYGPYVQIGNAEEEEKPSFASIPPDRSIFEIELADALKYFELPRKLGQTESGDEIEANIGKYGPYVRIGSEFFSIPEGEDPFDVTLERALEISVSEKDRKAQNVIQDLGDFQVLNGRYGPYIRKDGNNYNIPKGLDPASLDRETLEKFMERGPGGRRAQHVIQDFEGIQIIAGRYGPYIKQDGNNYRIPKDVEASSLTREACEKIIKENPATNKKKSRKK